MYKVTGTCTVQGNDTLRRHNNPKHLKLNTSVSKEKFLQGNTQIDPNLSSVYGLAALFSATDRSSQQEFKETLKCNGIKSKWVN